MNKRVGSTWAIVSEPAINALTTNKLLDRRKFFTTSVQISSNPAFRLGVYPTSPQAITTCNCWANTHHPGAAILACDLDDVLDR